MNQDAIRVYVMVLVSFSKVGAPRKGWSSGSGFWGESLLEETADASPGTLEAVGCFAIGFDVESKRGGGGQSKRRASVKLKHQELGLVMICRRLNKLPKRKTSFSRFSSTNA